MSDRADWDNAKPFYENAVDEYLALVNGPLRLVGEGRISPEVEPWHIAMFLDSYLDPLKPGFQGQPEEVTQYLLAALWEGPFPDDVGSSQP